ncbi:DUF2793 domain-containing protein [Microbulbifer sp. OS29]|uniref:DUF2793 domain-containing protein n=1 Tax=Microbulbifer okhotskensis TaxID=2926617 RepID=A0A9X2ER78_9GAMM|nr:DUF2793 domain-containing protein [Microbulbifer okhotskensis]MCO1336949.1 DUF2793 domain-containing protein [Microbulbifer okhotskensis]
MSNTPNNAIPYAQEGTLDPATSLNQALDTIDALLQIEVQGIQNDPPAAPADGGRYIVATGTGDWAGQDNQLARYVADPGYWQFFPAKVVLNQVDGLLYINGSSGWQVANRPETLPVITGDTSTDLAGVVGQMLGALDGVFWDSQTT